MSLPTLSLTGDVNNDHTTINKLYNYYITCDKNMTVRNRDMLQSLQYTLAVSVTDDDIIDNITKDLTILYNNYYNNVRIDVSIIQEDEYMYIEIIIVILTSDTNITFERSLKVNKDKQIQDLENSLDSYYEYYM